VRKYFRKVAACLTPEQEFEKNVSLNYNIFHSLRYSINCFTINKEVHNMSIKVIFKI